MKTKYYFSIFQFCFFILININIKAQSPDWLWSKSFGSKSNDVAYKVTVDINGNVYTVGSFRDTVDFDPGPGVFLLSSAGSTDIFISKLDSSGNFIWARAMGGSSDENGIAIAVDDSGNVLTTGTFDGTCDFDPGTGIFNLTSLGTNGFYNIFVSKLDPSGNFVWAKAMGGLDGAAGISLALDNAGYIYSTGQFGGTADFDPGTGIFNLTSIGNQDIYISKLDGNGNFVWAISTGTTVNDNSGISLALDISANVYITGYFGGTVDFDPGAGVANLTAVGWVDLFIAKLDSSHNFIWAKSLGGTNEDDGYGIKVDNFENVYFTGIFEGIVDFDPGAGIFNLTSAGNKDFFISKLDNSGNFLWAKTIGGSGDDYSQALTLDNAGNVYTSGLFYGTVDFNPGSGTFNLTASGSTADIFISKLDNSGNFVWAKSASGAGDDDAVSITIDNLKNIYVTGLFQSVSIPFGSNTLMNTDNTGNSSEIFIAKLDNIINTGIEDVAFNNNISVYPNPSFNNVTISSAGNISIDEINITDITGKIVYRTSKVMQKFEVNTKNFDQGVYFIQIKSNGTVETKKLVITK